MKLLLIDRIIYKFTFILILLLSFCSTSPAQEGKWVNKTDIPEVKASHSACVVNGKIYVMGGLYSKSKDINDSSTVSTVYEYDTMTDTWTRKVDMPTPRCRFATSVVNGKIYAIGGGIYVGDTYSTVDEYDPFTDTWKKKADIPTPRAGLSTSVVNGKIYAIGGWINADAATAVIEEYDPFRDKWTKKANMTIPRADMSASVVNGKIYIFGGRDNQLLYSTVE